MAKLHNLPTGALLPEAILALAKKDGATTAGVEGIGAVRKLRLAYFNHKTKEYEEHVYREFLEVTSLFGNVTTKSGKPFLHIHGTFGRRDLSVLGGHVISAEVFPLLEVVITPTTNRALRRFDEKSGLNTIFKT
ncbi:MAG: DUF296 domain-containing protein [Thaumarchaeota archaeon]|nr:DUF296 domain-containing protein [Nitrososphaerota archaeon]